MTTRKRDGYSVPGTSSWMAAKCYLLDYPLESKDLENRILGALRARDLKVVASATEGVCNKTPDFVKCRQVEAFFKKSSAFVDETRCTSAALEGFERAERVCRITNRRLLHYGTHRDRIDPVLQGAIDRMAEDIRLVLGDVGGVLDEVPNLMSVTGGATEDRSRRRALPFLKISGKLRAPRSTWPLIQAYLTWIGAESKDVRFLSCETNRVELVPKNWKTHRIIAAEPSALMPFQLAVDRLIRRRLLKWRVDLRKQEVNQELAREGSVDGSFCTVDLRSASDALALNAVALLVPPSWYRLLMMLRSPMYRGAAGNGTYAKYASMGNGLTFVLETLIFAAAVRATGAQRYAVYGDDIVLPTDRYALLERILNFLGFSVNNDKTFVDGPFRESCGADWREGINVTPFYVRSEPTSAPTWCHYVNGLVTLGYPGSHLWALARKHIKDLRLPLVPENSDTMSGVFIDPRTAYSLGIVRSRISTKPTRRLRRRVRVQGKTKSIWSTPGVGDRSLISPWMPVFKGFQPRGHLRANAGWRPYLLWFIEGGGSRSAETAYGSYNDLKLWASLEPEVLSYTMWATGKCWRQRSWCRYTPVAVSRVRMQLVFAFTEELRLMS
jgi:hypothetical protein